MKLVWDSKTMVARSEGKYIRERSDALYHTARWTRMSKAWRATHPLCEECKKKGIIKAAEVTDHIIPFPVCGREGFFSTDNLQSLCEACNNEKGQRDKKVIAEWKRTRR